jgi:tetratricopeptide (TPR) repeat protein
MCFLSPKAIFVLFCWQIIFVIPGLAYTLPHVGLSGDSGLMSKGILVDQVQENTQTHTINQATPPGNFPFQAVSSGDGLINVHFYSRPAGFGRDFANMVTNALQHPIADRLGLSLKKPVDIYVYNSRSDFLAGAVPDNPNETGAYTNSVTNSVYMPSLGGATDPDTIDTIQHEMTHVVFHQNMIEGHLEDGMFVTYPRWLDEGLAASDEPSSSEMVKEYEQSVSNALAHGSLINIFTTFNNVYPSNNDTDVLCYAESRSFVTYLFNTAGADTFHRFIADLAGGGVNQAALIDFGASLTTLQNNWRATLHAQSLPSDKQVSVVMPSPIPVTPGHEPTTAERTQPFHINGFTNYMVIELIWGGGFTLLLLVVCAIVWLYARRRYARRLLSTAGIPTALPDSSLALTGDAIPLSASESSSDASPLASISTTSSVAIATLDTPVLSTKQSLDRRSWLSLLLIIPVALLAFVISAQLGIEWRMPYLIAAGFCAAGSILVIVLGIRGLSQRKNIVLHGITLISLVCFVTVTILASNSVARAQGDAYESAGYYALAIQMDRAGNASKSTLARVYLAWGQLALNSQDYPTAIRQLRAAIQVDPSASQAHSVLEVSLEVWLEKLKEAGQYDQGIALVDDLLTSTTCDSKCHAEVQPAANDFYARKMATLLLSDQVATAVTLARTYVKLYHSDASAKSYQRFLDHAQSADLKAALSAATDHDDLAMNLLLQLIAGHDSHSDQSIMASQVAEPVTGTVPREQVSEDEVINFLALPDLASAQKFVKDGNTAFDNDSSLFKARGHLTADGKFTARLQPGYAYVAVWEDTAEPGSYATGYYYYIATLSSIIQPFTAQDVNLVE